MVFDLLRRGFRLIWHQLRLTLVRCRLTQYSKTGVEIHKFVSDLIYYPHRATLKVEKTDLTLAEFDFGLAEIHDVCR